MGDGAITKKSLLSGLIIDPKYVKKNPVQAASIAGAAALTAMSMGAASPLLAGAAGAGAAGAAGGATAAGLGGGTASLFGASPGLATGLLGAAEATPMITGAAAPFAAGATSSTPGIAGLMGAAGPTSAGFQSGLISASAAPKMDLSQFLANAKDRLGKKSVQQGLKMATHQEEQQPVPSPQQTRQPLPPDMPSFTQIAGMGGSTGLLDTLDEDEKKRRQLLAMMGG